MLKKLTRCTKHNNNEGIIMSYNKTRIIDSFANSEEYYNYIKDEYENYTVTSGCILHTEVQASITNNQKKICYIFDVLKRFSDKLIKYDIIFSFDIIGFLLNNDFNIDFYLPFDKYCSSWLSIENISLVERAKMQGKPVPQSEDQINQFFSDFFIGILSAVNELFMKDFDKKDICPDS